MHCEVDYGDEVMNQMLLNEARVTSKGKSGKKTVSMLLDHANGSFDLRRMFLGDSGVQVDIERRQTSFQRLEFIISQKVCDLKSATLVEMKGMFDTFPNSIILFVVDMMDRLKLKVSVDGEKNIHLSM